MGVRLLALAVPASLPGSRKGPPDSEECPELLLEVTACGRETLRKTCPGPFFTPLFGPEACPGPPALSGKDRGRPRDAAHTASLWQTPPLQLLVCPQDDLRDCTFWAFLLPLPGSKLSWSAAAPGRPIWKNQCILFREQAPRGPLSPQSAQGAGRPGCHALCLFFCLSLIS